MIRRLSLSALVLCVLAAIAWPKFHRAASPTATATPKTSSGPSAGPEPLRVTAVKVLPAPLAETVTATGTLRADEGVDLLTETNGRVVAINFTEGARVRRGDLLVKLNDADLQAMLERAVRRRELAELRERRFAQLLATNSVRQDDYDAALSDLNVQRAEVAIIEAQIAKTDVRAPFDGVIGLRFVSEGAFVNATSRIATLQKLDRVKVDFAVPEKYASRIRLDRPVTFTVPGSNRKFQGKIYAIEPRIDPATRTVSLRALCADPDGRLLPGGFANVEFTLDEIPDALLVPSIAIIPGVSEKTVFVVVEGKAARRTVQTGTRNETSVHITAGLKPGDTVITSGLQQLRVGLPVNVIGDDTAPKPGKKSAASAD